MQLLQPNRIQAYVGLRAMRMLAEADGPAGPAAMALLDAVQHHLLKTRFDLETLPALSPGELTVAFHDEGLTRQFFQAMCVLCTVDGPPSPRQSELLRAFGEALGVAPSEGKVLVELAGHHMAMFRFDFFRRSHLRGMVEDQLRRGGVLGGLRQFAAFRGGTEDPTLAARYRVLGDLPPDTLGYAFFRHCTDHGFAFPGERFGFPEAGVYHDFTHVLAGYGTTPEEELLNGAFIAGFRKENHAFMLPFVMLAFSKGINMAPLPQPHVPHLLATPGFAERFLRALQRGGAVRVDLSSGWDHWSWVGKPLLEARYALGIVPE
jgi:hypothetical protein